MFLGLSTKELYNASMHKLWIATILIVVGFLVWIYISTSSSTLDSISTPSPTPTLVSCIINGITVQATYEDCQKLNTPTPTPEAVQREAPRPKICIPGPAMPDGMPQPMFCN